ncbi:SDR family oxidoreductase (plasmid) [Rhizobium leguminosarum]|nr:SDR family oxidoreductase [Rhizobium leguminosarum]TAX88378.1 SDR family oxidoreductase [Rhizobium leguminosarum]TAX89540.1 SDR family oxidoreductase [Rhizobium leguminosarum]TAY90917.1 SDR family oxidoreductase [Rhizobium leguminosarum]TAZ04383.1 SDR family oxidoreductase [Rhizobium leguminosarum]
MNMEENMPSLNGKTVLITGALGTIGRSLVERYGQEGARVIASDLPGAENADETVRGLAQEARYFGADLNQLSDLESAVTKLADDVGGIDILVNNAAFVVNKPHEEFSIEEYEEEVRVNSTAAFVLARACSKHMKQKMYGKIINLTSLTLNGNWEGFVPYVASKGAMFGLVKSMARELGKYKITVNGISPGAVVSDAEWRHFGEKREAYHQWILERQSIKRRIEPVDIANLAVFLSSPQADLISGQDVHCDGGW